VFKGKSHLTATGSLRFRSAQVLYWAQMDGRGIMGRKPASAPTQGDYLAYLLRIWREGKGRTPWRASLQSPHTGEQLGFGCVDDLFDFLARQIDAAENRERDLIRERKVPGEPIGE